MIYILYIIKTIWTSQSIEIKLNGSHKRLNNLAGENREAHYYEYKEYLEIYDNNIINDGI